MIETFPHRPPSRHSGESRRVYSRDRPREPLAATRQGAAHNKKGARSCGHGRGPCSSTSVMKATAGFASCPRRNEDRRGISHKNQIPPGVRTPGGQCAGLTRCEGGGYAPARSCDGNGFAAHDAASVGSGRAKSFGQAAAAGQLADSQTIARSKLRVLRSPPAPMRARALPSLNTSVDTRDSETPVAAA